MVFATQLAQAGAITEVVKYTDKAGHAVAHAITPPFVKPVIAPVAGGLDKSGHVIAHGINVGVKFAGKVIW